MVKSYEIGWNVGDNVVREFERSETSKRTKQEMAKKKAKGMRVVGRMLVPLDFPSLIEPFIRVQTVSGSTPIDGAESKWCLPELLTDGGFHWARMGMGLYFW